MKSGRKNTDKKEDKNKNVHEKFPTSHRKIEISGKRFHIIRHFVGNKDLSTLLLELAERCTSREMDL